MRKIPKIKTLISAFLMLTISTATFGSAYAASKTYNFSTVESTVVFEAEDMILGKDASVISVSTASGGKSVKVLASSKNSSANNIKNPTLYADINVDKAGKYSLYARVKCPGVDSNEVYYCHTNKPDYVSYTFSAGANYAWVKMFDVTAISGVFSISFKYKETNLEFDKFVFTSKSDFNPVNSYDVPSGKEKLIYNSPQIKPIEGHPRLMATKDDIPKIIENTKSKELKNIYSTVVTYAGQNNIDCILPDQISSGTNFTQVIGNKIQARAFMSLIGETTSEYNKHTIELMKQLFATVKWDPKYQDITRTMGEVIVTGAFVYDWCYDDMTSADKEFFIAHFKKVAFTKEIGYPPTQTLAFAGHGGERELFYDLLSAGVACYDEDPEIYELAAGRFFDEYQKSRIEFNKTGSHPVGSAYGHGRYMWELCAATIFDAMGYKNIMGERISDAAYRYIYQRYPSGLWVKDNDDYTYSSNRFFSYSANYHCFYLLAAHLSGDEYIRGEWIKLQAINNYSFSSQYIWALLFSHPECATKSLEDLPLTYKMTYPLTALTARTGWQAGLYSPVSVIHMKAEEKNTTDTSFADLGNFMIYYKGNLAVNGGSYSYANTGGGWGGTHSRNYGKRTISKNCVTVYDPDEVFDTFYGTKYTGSNQLANDGGQHTFTPRVDNSDQYFKTPDLARTDGVYVGPNEDTPVFSYVKTDLTNAYSDKITKYSRSMVAINFFDNDTPQGFICFDNLESSNASFKKTWNLQSVEEPTVTGNETVIKRTEHGFNGKLTVNTLLPKSGNFTIEKVGGEGKESWVDGKNYPNPDPEGIDSEQGDWRIELSPKMESKQDVFLNAMFVSDADGIADIEPVYEETDKFYGVTMKNTSVYFIKEYNTKNSDEFTLNVRNNGYDKVYVLVTDVAEGKWEVVGTDIVTECTSKENAICVQLVPGTYTFKLSDKDANEQVFEKSPRNEIGDFNIYNRNGNINMPKNLFVYHDSPTKIIDGVYYVPMRSVFEALGAKVSWDGTSATIESSKTAVITPGTTSYTLNGNTAKLGYAPLNIDGVIYVHAADFNGTLGVTFSYDSLAKILMIS